MLPGKVGTLHRLRFHATIPLAQRSIKMRNFHHPKSFLVPRKIPLKPQRYPQKQTDESFFSVKKKKFCRVIKLKVTCLIDPFWLNVEWNKPLAMGQAYFSSSALAAGCSPINLLLAVPSVPSADQGSAECCMLSDGLTETPDKRLYIDMAAIPPPLWTF